MIKYPAKLRRERNHCEQTFAFPSSMLVCESLNLFLNRFFLFKVNLFIHGAEVGSLIKEANGFSQWFRSLHSVVSSLEKPLLAGYR